MDFRILEIHEHVTNLKKLRKGALRIGDTEMARTLDVSIQVFQTIASETLVATPLSHIQGGANGL